jgi:hypothetical protein
MKPYLKGGVVGERRQSRRQSTAEGHLTVGSLHKIEIQIYKLYEKYQFVEKPIKTF